jgi:hypothetical protein
MKTTDSKLLQALGLTSTSLVGEAETAAVPTGRALGAARPRFATPDGVLKSRLEQFRKQPTTRPVPLALLDQVMPQANVVRWVNGPSLVFVEFDTKIVSARHAGEVHELAPGSLVVDSEAGRALILLQTRHSALLLDIELGAVTAQRVSEPSVQQAFQPQVDAPLVPDLNVDELISGVTAEPWMTSAAKALAAKPLTRDRAAAAGLLGRYWSPPRVAGHPRDLLAELKAVDQGPLGKADAWARRLTSAQLDQAEREAIQTSNSLDIGLLDLERTLADNGPDAGAAGLAWLIQRDDLECVSRLLGRLGKGQGLRAALARLDEVAAARHSMWADVTLPENPRSAAWARDVTGSWWTMFGGSVDGVTR